MDDASTPTSAIVGEYLAEVDVLAHGFDFDLGQWTRRVDSRIAELLAGIPATDGSSKYRHISRADLLRASIAGYTPAAVLLGCYAWGTGTSSFLIGRRARVFRDNPAAAIDHHLVRARDLMRDHDPGVAYASLVRGSYNWLKWLGPSFFTKMLYAMDTPNGTAAGEALIFDQFVP